MTRAATKKKVESKSNKALMKVVIPNWFWPSFACAIDSGLPLWQALEVLAEAAHKSSAFGRVLADLSTQVVTGRPLSAAMKARENVFSWTQINLVAAGEAGGILDRILARIVAFERLERKCKRVSARWTGAKQQKLVTARFCLTTGQFLSSGIPILDTLDIVAKTLPPSYEKAILTVRQRISEGTTMSDAMEKTKCFPLLACKMVGIGEQTGSMDAMLTKIAELYFEELGLD